jgi:hypothetical protein
MKKERSQPQNKGRRVRRRETKEVLSQLGSQKKNEGRQSKTERERQGIRDSDVERILSDGCLNQYTL